MTLQLLVALFAALVALFAALAVFTAVTSVAAVNAASTITRLAGVLPFKVGHTFWAVDLGGSSFTAHLYKVVHGGRLQCIKTVKSKGLASNMHHSFITKKGTFNRNPDPASWRGDANVIAELLRQATDKTNYPVYVCETGPRRAETKTVHPQGWDRIMLNALRTALGKKVAYCLLPCQVEARFSVRTFWKNPCADQFSFFMEVGSTSTQAGTRDGNAVYDPMLGVKSTIDKTFVEILDYVKLLLDRANIPQIGNDGTVYIMGSLPYDARDLLSNEYPQLHEMYARSEPIPFNNLLALKNASYTPLLLAVFTELHARGFDNVVFDPKPVNGGTVTPTEGLTKKGWIKALFAENVQT